MIEIANYTYKYGEKEAVKDLSLTINDGEIFGLLGHNGAGKSTTIKSIVGIQKPSSGRILVNGYDVAMNPVEAKMHIGYVSDSPDKFLKLPAYLYWSLIASAYNISDDDFDTRLEYLLKYFEFEDHKYGVIESFSHGMRQKVFVIGALLSNPDILVLDEPLTGLDPVSGYNLKSMMIEHANLGNTVLFSTHTLEVAEQLCDRVGIMKDGKLIYVGDVEELLKIHPGKSLEEIYISMVERKSTTEGMTTGKDNNQFVREEVSGGDND